MADPSLAPLAAGDIVQVSPHQGDFGGSLVVITEVRSWGVIGYSEIPCGGKAYIRLINTDFVRTGGRIVWSGTDG